MRTRTTATVLLAAGLLAGCTSSHHSTPTTSPATASSAPAATPAPPSERPLPSGDTLATGQHTTACWRAIRDQYAPGTVQLTGAPTTPPQCAGLSTDQVSAIAVDVVEHQTDG